MTDYSIGFLTINIRNARLSGPSWGDRAEELVQWILSKKVSIVAMQECNTMQFESIKALFGPGWQFRVCQNVVVGWDVAKHTPVRTFCDTLPGPQSRGFIGVILERVGREGSWVFACSTHLTVNRPDAPRWRKKQVLHITNLVPKVLVRWMILGADLNSTTLPPKAAARLYFARMGLRHLRAVLAERKITRVNYNTFQGYGRTKTQGRWLDDILTGPAVQPHKAAVLLTHLTDHNGLRASIRVLTKLQPNMTDVLARMD